MPVHREPVNPYTSNLFALGFCLTKLGSKG
jgi:hypothetical protein